MLILMKSSEMYRTVSQLFDNGQLRNIAAKAHQLQALEEAIQLFLPDVLKHRCRVANFENQRLMLAVEDGALATQLKFRIPDLQAHLQAFHVQAIECKVIPDIEVLPVLPEQEFNLPTN